MQVFSAILNLVTWPASLVHFQVSSIIKCYRCHESIMLYCRRSKTAEENASPNRRAIFTSSEYHVT